MQVKKPDFKIFAGGAEDGELHDFPDVARGWGVTKLQTNKKPPLSWMNGAFNRVDNNFYYLLQNGLAEWDESLDYSKGALSQVDGVIYRAKEAVKGESPTTSAKWEKLLADKVGTSDFIGMSQKAIKTELDKKISSSDLTQAITDDKLKAPSNLAVNTALKAQDPRQWGFGLEGVKYGNPDDVPNKSICISGGGVGSGGWDFLGDYATGVSLFRGGGGDGSGFITQIAGGGSSEELGWRKRLVGIWSDWHKIYTTGNTSIDPNGVLTTKQATVTLTTNDLAKETGNSHSKVMTQKAVSDEIARLDGYMDYALVDFGVVSAGDRVIKSNPFYPSAIITVVEIEYDSRWGVTGYAYSSDTNKGFGANGGSRMDSIVVQVGNGGVLTKGVEAMGVHGSVGIVTSGKCRVHVWKLKV